MSAPHDDGRTDDARCVARGAPECDAVQDSEQVLMVATFLDDVAAALRSAERPEE